MYNEINGAKLTHAILVGWGWLVSNWMTCSDTNYLLEIHSSQSEEILSKLFRPCLSIALFPSSSPFPAHGICVLITATSC